MPVTWVGTNRGTLKGNTNDAVWHGLQMPCALTKAGPAPTSLGARALAQETTSQGGGFCGLDSGTLPFIEWVILDKLFCLLQPQFPYLLNRIKSMPALQVRCKEQR